MSISRRSFIRSLCAASGGAIFLAATDEAQAATGAAAFWYQTIVNEALDDWYIYYIIPVGAQYTVTSANATCKRILTLANKSRKSRVRVNNQTYDAVQIIVGGRARLLGPLRASWNDLTWFRGNLNVTWNK